MKHTRTLRRNPRSMIALKTIQTVFYGLGKLVFTGKSKFVTSRALKICAPRRRATQEPRIYMGKTKKTTVDAARKPSPKPNGVAKTPTLKSPLATAAPAGPVPSAPDKTTATKPKAAPVKKAATRSTAASKTSRSPSVISNDDIALRAYFISEKRRAKGLPGDEAHDWIEAERQLRAESAKPARARKTA